MYLTKGRSNKWYCEFQNHVCMLLMRNIRSPYRVHCPIRMSFGRLYNKIASSECLCTPTWETSIFLLIKDCFSCEFANLILLIDLWNYIGATLPRKRFACFRSASLVKVVAAHKARNTMTLFKLLSLFEVCSHSPRHKFSNHPFVRVVFFFVLVITCFFSS